MSHFQRRTITVNNPEKRSNARVIQVSKKLITMVKNLDSKSERLFSTSAMHSIKAHFYRRRKQVASKLQNPRLLNIGFHTLRHWKATVEYDKTEDLLHVRQLLGHKNINNTLIYTQLVSLETDDFHVKTARTLKEACDLAEAGFQYFTEIQGVQVFRKRK